MTTTAKFELPDVGLVAAFSACRECYEVVAREALIQKDGRAVIRAGSRVECFQCRNVMVATLIEKSAEPVFDRFRPFDKGTVGPVLVDFMFDTSIFNENTAKEWLDVHELKGFEMKSRDERARNFLRFSKDEKAVVDVYVPVERGIFGRCASK